VRPNPRRAVAAVLALALLALAACGPVPPPVPEEGADAAGPVPTRRPTPRPEPGHEVYGYIPYWEMDGTIAEHVASTPLTTVALFSVTNTGTGALDERQNGYRRITGGVGRQIVAAAHERGARVDLVFTSFGRDRNARFFGDRGVQDATIASLVTLAGNLGLDGVNVDVEGIDPLLLPEFGDFVERLGLAVRAADPDDQVSAATGANALGAAMAVEAIDAGADRVFLMGYDFRTAGSEPGATAPLDRDDGNPRTLRFTLDQYEALGVPVERTLLGLPLYGVTWPVAGPAIGAPEIGRGNAWIPRRNLELYRDPAAVPVRDAVEAVDVYFVDADGAYGPPPPGATGPPAGVEDRDWFAIYVDAPDTLERKLALANERGLAGGGFWAVGYERGLPAFTEVMRRFAAGGAMAGS
jgi:hypothetical protein